MQEKILIIDFGSQYTQLIARRVRELSVYCEIHPFNHLPAIDASVRGVILRLALLRARCGSPRIDLGDQGPAAAAGRLLRRAIPRPALRRRGDARPEPRIRTGDAHRSRTRRPAHGGTCPAPRRCGCRTATRSPACPTATASWLRRPRCTWPPTASRANRRGPSSSIRRSTTRPTACSCSGNFVVGICGCAQSWTSESFVETTVRELREKIRRRQGRAGAFGRRGLHGCRRAAAPRHRREPALHLRRFGSTAQERVRKRPRFLQGHGTQRQGRQGRRQVPGRPGRE